MDCLEKYPKESVIRSNKAIEDSYTRLGANIGGGKLKSSVDQAGANFSNLGRTAVNGNNAAAASFNELANSATQSGEQMTKEIINIRSEFEGLYVAFTTILKSKERADALMNQVISFAANTPFGLTETAKATKQLLAYGVSSEDVIDELRTLGDVAAGVSQPVGELAYLYGTLKTQGRAYAMDIRQFTGRGIPIIAELAKVLGVAKNEVMGLVEEGKVGFPEVQKAFQNMSGAGGAFFNLMDKQSLTTGGRISNLKDNIDQMFNSFGESNTSLINAGISGISSLVANYESVVDVLTILIAGYGAYRAALAVTNIFQQLNIDATAAHIAALNAQIGAETAVVAIQQKVALQSGINA
nr:hypothetical protein [Tanacetum cinerariifolium]